MYIFVPFAQLKWLCIFFSTPFGGPRPLDPTLATPVVVDILK